MSASDDEAASPGGRMAFAPSDLAGDGRAETVTERADRNWNDVLQELRVLQTGTQILTGFLLAVAFQPAFDDLAAAQRGFYLVLLVLAALSAIIALSPVAMHRGLFRRLAKPDVVAFGHRALVGALATVGVLLVGVVAFVFDVVLGVGAAGVAAGALSAIVVILWLSVPVYLRNRHSQQGGHP